MKEYKVALSGDFKSFSGQFIFVKPLFTYKYSQQGKDDDGIVFYYKGYGYVNAMMTWNYEEVDNKDGTFSLGQVKQIYHTIRYDWPQSAVQALKVYLENKSNEAKDEN